MIVKIINSISLTEANIEEIIGLMDVFRKPKGKDPISKESVRRAVSQKTNTVVVACKDDKIVGMATLIEENLFTANVGIVDEVVVSEDFRGKGVASKILEEIIEIATQKKIDLLKLDTTPESPANRLYEKCGFVKKEANVYKLFLNSK